jgi:hypothetical protein
MIVFSTTRRPSVFGWTYERSLVVLAWFTLLKAVLEGGVTPSLLERGRGGAQRLARLRAAQARRRAVHGLDLEVRALAVVDFLGAAAIFVYAFEKMGRWPSGHDLVKAGGSCCGRGAAALLDLDPGGERRRSGWCAWTTSATCSRRSSTPGAGPSTPSSRRC